MTADITQIINNLWDLPGFKMNGRVFEADGNKYDGSWGSPDEVMLMAYIFFMSKMEAKALVKNAKITLGET